MLKQRERILYCAECGLMLPLCLPVEGETSRSWACTGCGARYEAVLDKSQPLELIQHVRPYKLAFNLKCNEQVPKAIADFIAQVMPDAYRGPEKRCFERYPIVTPVAAMPLGTGLEPFGASFMALTRNISRSGVALVSTRSVSAPFLAVELPCGPDGAMQVVIQVVRRRPIRCFYEIAGPFLTKMADAGRPQQNAPPPAPDDPFGFCLPG